MLTRFFLLLISLALFAPLHAQDLPVDMRPPFPLIFPLTQDGTKVTVKFPVMINPTTILKPGMQLRVLYNLSVDAQSGGDHVFAHKGSLEDAYARDPAAGTRPDSDIPPNLRHELDGYRRTVWQVSGNFVMAMAQYPTDSMRLIYSPNNRNDNLHDERFNFFDGLMVGLPTGQVTVIAVEKESKCDRAGIKAGDTIISVGGIDTDGDLSRFASAYSRAKKASEDNAAESYLMMVQSPNGANPRAVNIMMPQRIKSGLMDGF